MESDETPLTPSESPEDDGEDNSTERSPSGKNASKCPDPKVCGVCGDKALGNNFNAITCESCKAFFRRNALRTKEFVCPFIDKCKVDAITRRFCQKCRLKKCIDIGMKKEWIMTDEEKKIKKQKIEQNRLKRTSWENGSSNLGEEQDSTSSPPAAKVHVTEELLTNQKNSGESGDVSETVIAPRLAKQPMMPHNHNSSPYPFTSTPVKSVPEATKEGAKEKQHVIQLTPVSTSGSTEHSGYSSDDSGSYSMPQIIHVSSQQNLVPSSGANYFEPNKHWAEGSEGDSSSSSSSHPPPLVTHYQSEHTPVKNTMENVDPTEASNHTPLLSSLMQPGQSPPEYVASPVQGDSEDMNRNAGTYPKPVSSYVPVIQSQEMGIHSTHIFPHSPPHQLQHEHSNDYYTVTQAPTHYSQSPPIMAPYPQSHYPLKQGAMEVTERDRQVYIGAQDHGTHSSPEPNKQHAQFFEPAMSRMALVQTSRATPSPRRVETENDVMPLPLNTMDSILSVAIAAEFNAFGMLGANLNSKELNKAEQAKLNELLVAGQALNDPVDAERPIKVSETSDPSLINVINLTEIAIRRLIKMSKKISGFKNMCQEDQIALLKGGCTEMMILRSVVTYDPDRDSWQIPHSNPGYNINLGVLKEARGNLYEEHQRFVKSFRSLWRMDENVMIILCAITLFTPERLNVIHKDVVKLEQDSYYYLLKRYLESVLNGCEAKSTYLQLIRKIAELRVLNSNHVRVFLEVNPKEVEPLLIEIFDLK